MRSKVVRVISAFIAATSDNQSDDRRRYRNAKKAWNITPRPNRHHALTVMKNFIGGSKDVN